MQMLHYLFGVLNYGDNFYLPISEMTNIYNVEAFTNKDSAVIASLYEEFTTIKTTSKVSIKERTSGFSKTVQKVQSETELIFLDDSEKKNWTKVLTYQRKFWICKD